jgi:hypothetical protein
MCVREEHEDIRHNQMYLDTPRAERVASIAFVQNPEDVFEAWQARTAAERKISANGIGKLRWRGGLLPNVLFLPITPAEQDYSIGHAATSLAGGGKAHDPHIALHSIPGTEEFEERMVTLDELR